MQTPASATPAAADEGLRYRLGVLSRALAAIFGGYAVAALLTALLSLTLPTARVDAVAIGTLASFAVYTCAVLWVFAARSALRAWLGLLLVAAPAGLAVAVLYRLAGSAA